MKAEAAKLAAVPVTQRANADGSTTWEVNTVGGFIPPSDVQQFFPPTINVRAGDTVSWKSSVPTPHTVTFLGGTPLIVPPSLENPRIFLPTAASAAGYEGVGYVNSGVIGLGFPGQSFSVKFARAGTFAYLCLLHVDQGMGGTITVGAAAAAPVPPKTGAGAASQPGTSFALAGGLALLAVASVLGARFASRRGA